MLDLSFLLDKDAFSFDNIRKRAIYKELLTQLVKHHYDNCLDYKKMLDVQSYDLSISILEDIPFLPVSLFKKYELKSMLDLDVYKVLKSSGTTGQNVSKIYLDKNNAALQQKVLLKIVSDFCQITRNPMLILDTPETIKNRLNFSARSAAILGFSLFGTDKFFAFDNDFKLDLSAVNLFLEKHRGKQIMLFGFTFIVWKYLYKQLVMQGIKLDLSDCILIHGGGWKKLKGEAVSNTEFKSSLKRQTSLKNIYDYYGMAEQTGSIYLECSEGHLHCSIFSEIIIRNATDFSECNIGEIGIVQVVSLLAQSYCGHSLLTEDFGKLIGIDDCKCGRKGKYFNITGRVEKSDDRGCSDTYEFN